MKKDIKIKTSYIREERVFTTRFKHYIDEVVIITISGIWVNEEPVFVESYLMEKNGTPTRWPQWDRLKPFIPQFEEFLINWERVK